MGGGAAGAMDMVGAGVGAIGDAVRGLYEDDLAAQERDTEARRYGEQQRAIAGQTRIENLRAQRAELRDERLTMAQVRLMEAQAISALAEAKSRAIGGAGRTALGDVYKGNTPLMPNVSGGGVYGEAAGSYGMLVGEAYGIADWFDDVATNIRQKLGVGSRVLGKPRTLQPRVFSKGRGK